MKRWHVLACLALVGFGVALVATGASALAIVP
jgi:hypothetical protein